ncbi:hypothetical protein [Lacrimispora sp.]|uniref:hypothetical protein n=1 Tax=Lacrimispora sp. TaxID=2719234 RepID=UPI00286E07F6|nr:hypothetical protein [Lacrimispora sp.]
MYQICCIVAAAKRVLKEKRALSYIPPKYENRIEFQFLPEKKLFSTKKYKDENVPEWYDHCLKKGLYDLKLLAPITVNERSILGFSNKNAKRYCMFL